MKKDKILFISSLVAIFLLFAVVISSFFFEVNESIVKLSCTIIGLLLPAAVNSFLNLMDKMPWQTYLRFMLRKKIITKDTEIRISFSMFFKIRVDETYFLIPNIYGISKFQIPGYTYRMSNDERKFLIKTCKISADDRMKSKPFKDDYRVFVKSKYLRKFMQRFGEQVDVEKGENVENYFYNLFIVNKYLPEDIFSKINFFYVKRDIVPIRYSHFFDCFELLLRDVYEIELSDQQLDYMRKLKQNNSRTNNCYFATKEQIKTQGVSYKDAQYESFISEHTRLLIDD